MKQQLTTWIMAFGVLLFDVCAQAVPTLTISDPYTTSSTDVSGTVGYANAAFSGAWSIVIITAKTKPALGTATNPQMDIDVQATSLGYSGRNLTITFSDNNFGPTSTNMVAVLTGHIIAGTGSDVKYSTYYDAGNVTGAQTTLLTSSGSLSRPIYASSITGGPLNQALCSLTQVITIQSFPGASYSVHASMSCTNKPAASVSLGNLCQTYDGTAKRASATTSPPGLTVDLTYNGSASAPTNAGNYTVVGTINDPNYEGSSTNTLVILSPWPGGSVTMSGGAATMRFLGVPGIQYDVQLTTDLTKPASWTTLTSGNPLTPGADGSFCFTDCSASNSAAYYRSVQH